MRQCWKTCALDMPSRHYDGENFRQPDRRRRRHHRDRVRGDLPRRLFGELDAPGLARGEGLRAEQLPPLRATLVERHIGVAGAMGQRVFRIRREARADRNLREGLVGPDAVPLQVA